MEFEEDWRGSWWSVAHWDTESIPVIEWYSFERSVGRPAVECGAVGEAGRQCDKPIGYKMRGGADGAAAVLRPYAMETDGSRGDKTQWPGGAGPTLQRSFRLRTAGSDGVARQGRAGRMDGVSLRATWDF